MVGGIEKWHNGLHAIILHANLLLFDCVATGNM